MRTLTRIVVWMLNNTSLSLEDRSALITAILDVSHALPFSGIIEVDQTQRLLVNGRPVDKEQAIKLRIAAKQLQNNYAYQFLREHIDYQAVKEGMYKSFDPMSLMFAKTAIWNGQQEERFIELLAGESTVSLDDD